MARSRDLNGEAGTDSTAVAMDEVPAPVSATTATTTTTAAAAATAPASGPEPHAALQVIVLGSGGGPLESNVTAMLVRSVKAGWSRGCMAAVDAGTHMAAIKRILDETQPPGLGTDIALPHILESGPFSGLELNSISSTANASHITRQLIDTYLVTHPHLDHISGFVINTAGLPGTRPKRLAGLPSTISAFKTHIFNNVIWPNLSDESNGAGLLTYMRLVEGGSPALGEGDDKGYVEISDGLTVKVFGVSHGHCIERHIHRGSTASSRFGSIDGSSLLPPRESGRTATSTASSLFRTSAGFSHSSPGPGSGQEREHVCVYDSSAYFIRDAPTGREVLIFGDVEPDSISLSPRNLGIWQEAAPRISGGNLRAIFIECSYDDSQTEDRLFGHLTPRYVFQELKVLAAEVEMLRPPPGPKLETTKKRKRELDEAVRRADRVALRLSVTSAPATTAASRDEVPVSPKSARPTLGKTGDGDMVTASGTSDHGDGNDSPHISTPTAEMDLKDLEPLPVPHFPAPVSVNALEGLTVVIIHVKERLGDGEPTHQTIYRELLQHESEAQLGCKFVVSSPGQSFKF